MAKDTDGDSARDWEEPKAGLNRWQNTSLEGVIVDHVPLSEAQWR